MIVGDPMGVMPCAREGCEHIMCRRYNSHHGYICEECFADLVVFLAERDGSSVKIVEAFMNIPVGSNQYAFREQAKKDADELFPECK